MGNFTQPTANRRPVVVGTPESYAVEFNISATPQFLTAPIPAGLPGSVNWAIGLWFVRRGDMRLINDYPPLFQVGVAGGSTTAGAGLSTRSTDEVNFGPTGVDPINAAKAPYSVLALDTPVHLIGVCEGAELRLYVDGVLNGAAQTGAPMPTDMSDFAVTIGAASDGDRAVPIQASNLQIWNIAPTEQQIQDLAMKRIEGPLPSGLVFYAPM